MSKHKLIMENWRKFLAEDDRGYRTTTPDGNDIYLIHDTLGPTGKSIRLTLYTIPPEAFFIPPGEELNMEELLKNQKDIGSIFIFPATGGPCIPETYQVGAVHTAPDFDREGYGTLLYDLAFLVAGTNGWGLTSDRDAGTKETASSIWADIAANDAKYEKRKTPEVPIAHDSETAPEDAVPAFLLRPQPPEGTTHIGGNDTFDYTGKTPDPEDDCRKDRWGSNATNHSFMMKDMTEIEEVYKHLTRLHRGLIGLVDQYDPSSDPKLDEPGEHGEYVKALLGTIIDRTSDNFGDRYDQADE